MATLLDPTSVSLPLSIAAALAAPTDGDRTSVPVSGRRWMSRSWGRTGDPPLLLVHGIMSSAGVWWRVGAGLAAAGHRVVAVDLPGHGPNPDWQGRHRFDDTAADLAGFVRAAGLDTSDLAVVGHSWGGIVSAHLPAMGTSPACLVLLDPPILSIEQLEAMADDPWERRYATIDEARAAVLGANPALSEGDVEAKALALTEFDEEAMRAVLLRNSRFDGGLSALRDERAARIPTWLIRGDPVAGGLIPDDFVSTFAALLGSEHIISISGAPHAPQRSHPEATTFAILHALNQADRQA